MNRAAAVLGEALGVLGLVTTHLEQPKPTVEHMAQAMVDILSIAGSNGTSDIVSPEIKDILGPKGTSSAERRAGACAGSGEPPRSGTAPDDRADDCAERADEAAEGGEAEDSLEDQEFALAEALDEVDGCERSVKIELKI